jgi:SMI1 / KNR4 family (SUKH-1)
MASLPSPAEVDEFEQRIGIRLPGAYRRFLLAVDGVQWDTGTQSVRLYGLSAALGSFEVAQEYQRKSHPGLVYIGDDGGSEGLAYDTRLDPPPLLWVRYSSPGWTSGQYQAASLPSSWTAT